MKTFFGFFFLMIFSMADAQGILSVEDAVKIALKNNYDIRIAGNDAAISQANNTLGNAGMLPEVGITGNGGYDVNHVKQKLSGGTETNYSGFTTKSYSAGVELSWTLFDGGKMFVTKNKLNEIEVLGDIQFRDMILQTQYNVIAAYYDVVRQKQQLVSINQIISYNTELVKILQTGFDAGSTLKNDLLQSKIDLNVYKENAINQEFTIDAAIKALKLLLGLDADTLFEVSDSIPLNYAPNKNELLQKLDVANTGILSIQKQLDIAKLNLKEYSSFRYPLIGFKAGYYTSQTDNSAGTILQNHSWGPQLGGTVSIPLYQSGNINRQISIARIGIESARFELENVKLQARTELLNAIEAFDNQQRLLAIEKENNGFATENLVISLQRMKHGQTTSLEVHQAQDNYVQSFTRLINFEYNLKIAETRLKQLIANL